MPQSEDGGSNPEDLNLNLHCCENLNFLKLVDEQLAFVKTEIYKRFSSKQSKLRLKFLINSYNNCTLQHQECEEHFILW
jgi:hypothetical protein